MILQNKVAIVTGASKGIGLAVTKALLEKGAKVAGWSRSEPDFQHKNFVFIPVDMRSEESVNDAFKQTNNHFGNTISVLINNAGLGYAGLIEEMTVDEWREMFDTNVHGIFYASRRVIPKMKTAREGHIINIASIAGKQGIEQMAGYCGTKFAVRGITESMFKELRNFGIKVSSICPGSVNTSFFDSIDFVTANEHMMTAQDIASTVIHVLESSPNYHILETEVRPLIPRPVN